MTLRQVLGIIWQRWLLVLVTTLLVVGATVGYVTWVPQVYESTAMLRYSLAASRVFDGGSGYGGVELDLDTFFVTSEDVLAGAVAETGESSGALRGATSVRLLEGVRTNRLQITSEGGSPEQAQARANAVAHAYIEHLQQQVDTALAELEISLVEAEQERAAAVQAAGQNPDDRFIQEQLSQALSRHLDLTRQIESIENAGPPLSVMQGAHPGSRLGTDAPTLIMIAIISGLIAGAGLALIRAQFDDRVRNPEAMQEATGQPVLAEVPQISRKGSGDLLVPVAGMAPTPFNESIRNLRTSLQVAYPIRHAAIVITSPMPGDGKTFLTANLAVSVARSGRSVVLISGDLRRPQLGTYFGIRSDTEGFAEVLQSDATVDEIEEQLVQTQFDNLRLLPAGVARGQPADLLAGDTLPRVIQRIRSLADVTLIDTPPGLALADALLLGTEADGVVVVTSLKSTNMGDLQATVHSLESNGATVAGIVANRSKAKLDRRYGVYYNVAQRSELKKAEAVNESDKATDDSHPNS